MTARQMKLGLFVRPCGHHIASWRHPLCQADAGVNFPHFVEMAKTAEGKAKARELFARARAGYHPIAATMVEGILK